MSISYRLGSSISGRPISYRHFHRLAKRLTISWTPLNDRSQAVKRREATGWTTTWFLYNTGGRPIGVLSKLNISTIGAGGVSLEWAMSPSMLSIDHHWAAHGCARFYPIENLKTRRGTERQVNICRTAFYIWFGLQKTTAEQRSHWQMIVSIPGVITQSKSVNNGKL